MTPNTGSKRNQIIKIGCVGTSFLVLGLCLWLNWAYKQRLYPPNHFFTIEDQTYRSDVISAFAFSMAHNRIENLRAYVAPDRLDRLENWPDVHEALTDECHFDSDPDLSGYSFSGHQDRDPTVWHHSLWFYYYCPDKSITFTIDDITLQQLDGNWYITDWGKICEEGRGRNNRCW